MKILKLFSVGLLLGLFACKSTTDVIKAMELEYDWELILIENETPKKEDFPIEIPNLVFKKYNKIHGTNGCNGFSGDYFIDNSKLILNNVISTKMYCENSKDRYLMSLINKSDFIKITDNKLIFVKDNKDVLVYKKK